MPIIQVNMLRGRTPEQKRRLAAGITAVAEETLGVKPEQVRVLIHEMGADDFSVGGKTAAERGQTVPPPKA